MLTTTTQYSLSIVSTLGVWIIQQINRFATCITIAERTVIIMDNTIVLDIDPSAFNPRKVSSSTKNATVIK